METATERIEDGIILKVSGTVTISDAGELRRVFMDEVPSGTSVTIDLADTTGCGLSFFQLLCAVHKQCLATAASMRLRNCTGEVQEAMASAGILRTAGCAGNENENCLWHETMQR